jgi:putative ABC transport system ATP-binding protein
MVFGKIKHRPIIELKDIWKTYNTTEVHFTALREINLAVDRGDFISIMGPSGSGKSTLMNLIGCLDLPSQGEIFLEGRDISKLPESALAQLRGKKIGFIFQDFDLIQTLSALENVMTPMIFQRKTMAQMRNRAEALLKAVGLGDRMKHKPGELSGGEQQRVAIARALANNPDIVLADEPTGNLDSKTSEDIIKILGNLHKKNNTTLVVVTHEREIAKFAHKVIHLKDGKIINEEILKRE